MSLVLAWAFAMLALSVLLFAVVVVVVASGTGRDGRGRTFGPTPASAVGTRRIAGSGVRADHPAVSWALADTSRDPGAR
jgi:hypothetical protein